MSKIRVALFGMGRMGRNHRRVIQESEDFELVAVIDPAFAQEGKHPPPEGAAIYSTRCEDTSNSTRPAVSPSLFDAAVVSVPTPGHAAVTGWLLDQGKHVLCEKPLAGTTEKCGDVLDACGLYPDRLVVGHVERFNPAVRKMRELLQQGAVGWPIHYSVTRVGGYPDPALKGNNVALDLAVHDLDLLRLMAGELHVIESVTHRARMGEVDTAEILLRRGTAVEVTASLHVNWITPVKIRTYRVTGTAGVLMADLVRGVVTVATEQGTTDHHKESLRNFTPGCGGEPLARQLAQFARFVRTGAYGVEGTSLDDLCTPLDAMRAVALAEHALR